MGPAAARSMLARQIAQHGQTITIVRTTGTTSPTTVSATIKAWVRGDARRDETRSELVGQFQQGDLWIVINPADLEAASWPGSGAVSGRASIVPIRGDKITVESRVRSVMIAEARDFLGTIVRINLIARG